jgi:hypothetical protein
VDPAAIQKILDDYLGLNSIRNQHGEAHYLHYLSPNGKELFFITFVPDKILNVTNSLSKLTLGDLIMAKNTSPYGKKAEYPYPSYYGSHASMVDQTLTQELNQPGKVVCKDEIGSYVTTIDQLDNGLADRNRYSQNRPTP